MGRNGFKEGGAEPIQQRFRVREEAELQLGHASEIARTFRGSNAVLTTMLRG